MTRITIVNDNGQEKKISVSSEDAFQRCFQGLSLLDEDGYQITGYACLVESKSYTYTSSVMPKTPVTKVSNVYPSLGSHAPSPPPQEATQRALSPTPPRDGIEKAPFRLPRQELVERLLTLAKSIVILRSPPATGKTSLVDLVQYHLQEELKPARVIRINIGEDVNDDHLIKRLAKRLGVHSDDIGELEGDTWILIDDAQLAFDAPRFWKIIVKDFARIHGVNVIIACTYDLLSQGSTPYSFGQCYHVSDLLLAPEEAEELYNGYASSSSFLQGWISFKDTLLRLSGGHVGVLTGGISMLQRIYVNEQKRLTESEALSALRDHRFRINLQRAFPCEKLMNEEQRDSVAQKLIDGPTSAPINASQGSTDDSALVQLVRAGIFSSSGTFSCPVAQFLYYNTFFCRATKDKAPTTIEALVLQSVQSLSALRLRQSCVYSSEKPEEPAFPKEAAFQQLFNEAFTRHLPVGVAVCPELNTFAENEQGEAVSGELDFFIGKDRLWAIEMLRNGRKINEHAERFDPKVGKYRKVGYTDFLVVDCRGPLTKEVQTMQSRCTLYFSDDFKTVTCKMRKAALTVLSLKP